MRRVVTALMFLFLLVSCGLFKDTFRTKRKTNTHIIERGTITYKAPGEQILYLPNIKVKDTDIVIRKPRTILKAKKRSGDFKRISCETPPLDVKKQYEKETDQSEKVKDFKSQGLTFKPVYLMYLFGGLGFLILVNNLTKRK